MQKQVIDLNELVSDTVRLVETEAAHREVTIEAQLAPSPCLVSGDRIQLQQLLINLVINAMDAMAETPVAERKVILRVLCFADRKIEIAVSDAGHGIADHARGRLFDSFFTTKPKGLGLGLSIARTIAEAHGGNIRSENHPSGGATFRITLPEAQTEPCPANKRHGVDRRWLTPLRNAAVSAERRTRKFGGQAANRLGACHPKRTRQEREQ